MKRSEAIALVKQAKVLIDSVKRSNLTNTVQEQNVSKERARVRLLRRIAQIAGGTVGAVGGGFLGAGVGATNAYDRYRTDTSAIYGGAAGGLGGAALGGTVGAYGAGLLNDAIFGGYDDDLKNIANTQKIAFLLKGE